MEIEEYRRLHMVKEPPKSMSAAEWREQMKKKSSKPKSDHANDMRIKLELAKIDFMQEYVFHPTRKWRFDFAIVDKKIGLEYEGLFSKKSGHTTVDGFMKDVEKYNAAVKLGWRVLRYTAHTYKNVIDDLKEII